MNVDELLAESDDDDDDDMSEPELEKFKQKAGISKNSTPAFDKAQSEIIKTNKYASEDIKATL
jgi:hypothetical protein